MDQGPAKIFMAGDCSYFPLQLFGQVTIQSEATWKRLPDKTLLSYPKSRRCGAERNSSHQLYCQRESKNDPYNTALISWGQGRSSLLHGIPTAQGLRQSIMLLSPKDLGCLRPMQSMQWHRSRKEPLPSFYCCYSNRVSLLRGTPYTLKSLF